MHVYVCICVFMVIYLKLKFLQRILPIPCAIHYDTFYSILLCFLKAELTH